MTIAARAARIGGALIALAPLPAAAIPLLPGEIISPEDYFDAAVAPGDPAWFGTVLGSQTAFAARLEDGFDGFETVMDLNAAGGRIDSTVSDTGGSLTFAYVFGDDAPLSFEGSSTISATIRGFAGYAVDVAPVGEPLTLYVPIVSRSPDGDAIFVDFSFGLDDPLSGLVAFDIEEIRFRTDAPSFRAGGAAELALGLESFSIEDVAALPGVLVPAPIPLPAGLPLMLTGLGALGLTAWRRKG